MSTLILVLLLFILLPIAIGGLYFAPWLPTRNQDLSRIIRLSELETNQAFADLGSGTGTVILGVAAKTNARVIGYEFSLLLYLISRIRIRLLKSRASVKLQNFFVQDLSGLDVIYLFGTPKGLQKKLEKKIWKECRPGTKILSYAFQFADHNPVFVDKPTDKDLSIYVYRV